MIIHLNWVYKKDNPKCEVYSRHNSCETFLYRHLDGVPSKPKPFVWWVNAWAVHRASSIEQVGSAIVGSAWNLKYECRTATKMTEGATSKIHEDSLGGNVCCGNHHLFLTVWGARIGVLYLNVCACQETPLTIPIGARLSIKDICVVCEEWSKSMQSLRDVCEQIGIQWVGTPKCIWFSRHPTYHPEKFPQPRD